MNKIVRMLFCSCSVILLLSSSALALQWPSPSSTVTSGYGWRIHPIQGIPRWHNGIDISTGGTNKLKAVVSGTIEHIRRGGISGNRILAGSWQCLHLANSFGLVWDFAEDIYQTPYFAINVNGTKVYYSTASRIFFDLNDCPSDQFMIPTI